MVSRPIALALTLCDYVIVEERTRKASLIGTFSGIAADRFPTTVSPFCVFALLTNGSGDGTAELVISRLDTGDELYTYRHPLHFPDPLAELRYLVRIRQFEFPVPGWYQFTLLVDGEWVAQRRLHVYQKDQES